MIDKLKDIDIKNRAYYFFDDMSNIENPHPDTIKIYENLYKNVLIYYIGYVNVKDLCYTKRISVKPLYVIINKKFDTLKRVMEINL